MEHLWSQAVATMATGGKWDGRKMLKQAKTAAAGCDRLPETVHGKGELPRKGGGRLSGSARSAKSCEPEGPQDLTSRLLHAAASASTEI
jgi:hypothetical protein